MKRTSLAFVDRAHALYALLPPGLAVHAPVVLVDSLADVVDSAELRPLAADLDLHYVRARDPNGLPALAPFQAYIRAQAERAVTSAERLFEVTRSRIALRDAGSRDALAVTRGDHYPLDTDGSA